MAKIEAQEQRTKDRGDTWEIGEEGLLRENIETEYVLVFGGQNGYFDLKKKKRSQ